MNKKRFAISTLVGFALLFILDFIIHGILLTPLYEQTADLWRPMEEYESFMPFATAMQFIMVAVLCFIYTRHHEGKGLSEGVRFGVMFGFLIGIMQFSTYAWMPIPITLASAWFVTGFVEIILIGISFSLLYKK